MQWKSVTTCHKGTDAQPVSKQQPPWKPKTPCFLYSGFCCWARRHVARRIPPASLGQLSQLPAQPQPAQWGRGRVGNRESPGTAQRQPKYWSVVSTGLATNPEGSALMAAVNKVRSVPARHSTKIK